MPESRDVTWEAVKVIHDRLYDDLDSSFESVVLDLEHRSAAGEEKYGVRLHTHNGRDALIDLYEELLDAYVYATQFALETDDGGEGVDDMVDHILDAIGEVTTLLTRRMIRNGFVRARAPQPAPLFDQPLVRE